MSVAEYTPPAKLFDPTPYGAGLVYTPLKSAAADIEWWRTQHALGRPVDLNALFDLAERGDEETEEALAKAKRDADESGRGQQVMADAIDVANEAVNAVRTVFAEEILGKLNQIDRNVVAKLVKEQLKKMDAIQKQLTGSI